MFQTIEADREAEREASETEVTSYKAAIEPEGQCTGHRRQRSCRITGIQMETQSQHQRYSSRGP